jgi:hypothetical protein
MKRVHLLIIVSALALQSHAQASKWFFTVSALPSFGGPLGSINDEMVRQGFNQQSHFNIFGIDFTSSYPYKERAAAFMARGGWRVRPNRSIYVEGGITSAGTVAGFKESAGGAISYFLFFGGSSGTFIRLKYRIYSLGCGYEYSFTGTRAKLAVGPNLFLFHYGLQWSNQWHTTPVPGVSGYVRLPLGHEKRLFGLELVGEFSLALPARTKDLTPDDSGSATFSSASVNMVHGNLGLAFHFTRK